ncbi:hypothetical protein [uncultured Aquimarina sp.]|uniref:hypothetical protein n=1 Tax=uncultured Aquimarina sp. TaxID=575652 RepID=UPI002622FFD2|nr:hypothetical protein [uncultured Aquimarina sp.]
MINTILRLEFEHVFDNEEQQDVLFYLGDVSEFMLLNVIGFTNTSPLPSFDNFFSNPSVQNDIIERVINYCRANNITNKPDLISREACLRLAEIILSNKESLFEEEKEEDRDRDEINVFKTFLVLNKEVNAKQNLTNSVENEDRIADMMMSMSFSSIDSGLYNDNTLDIAKLLYATIVRFEMLIEFLQSKEEYKYLEKDICSYFGQESSEELLTETKYLFAQILRLIHQNEFKFQVDLEKSVLFLESLVGDDIQEIPDFTSLKNYPLYKIDKNIFSVIDYFFLMDKFVKSVRFILKDSFEKYHNLPSNDRTFFSWYNNSFSEDFLIASFLDKIFHQKYLVKKAIPEGVQNEPDYYVRNAKRVFLFEIKDVLIRGDIKASGDIDKINTVLKQKFLKSGRKDIGIGQLVNHIAKIVENEFQFDDYVNTKNNITLYPILLVSDRIFELPGANFRLNQWYLESVKEKLGDKYNPSLIKSLTVIDFDTLIYWESHLVKKDGNFRKILDTHLKALSTKVKINNRNLAEGKRKANIEYAKKLSPISNRLSNYKFPMELLVDKFRDVLPE